MVLGFMQWFDSKKTQPTHFREKILAGAGWSTYKDGEFTVKQQHNELMFPGRHPSTVYAKKLHTIRLDPHNRWHAGRKIEMVYRGAGYKIIDHFNKGIPELETCVSTQKINIEWTHSDARIYGDRSGLVIIPPIIRVDGHPIGLMKMKELSQSDGFEYVEDFLQWFNKDFTGKIIHFTSLRY